MKFLYFHWNFETH